MLGSGGLRHAQYEGWAARERLSVPCSWNFPANSSCWGSAYSAKRVFLQGVLPFQFAREELPPCSLTILQPMVHRFQGPADRPRGPWSPTRNIDLQVYNLNVAASCIPSSVCYTLLNKNELRKGAFLGSYFYLINLLFFSHRCIRRPKTCQTPRAGWVLSPPLPPSWRWYALHCRSLHGAPEDQGRWVGGWVGEESSHRLERL